MQSLMKGAKLDKPETINFKEYKDLEDKEAHFLIIEVEGDETNALDLRNNLEKLEYPGIGMTWIENYPSMFLMIDRTKEEKK